MKKKPCALRRGNAGFSLVELLIAVVILGLIVGPLLHTFVTAAGTVARSRKLGDATLVTQNIAEAVEAGDLSNLPADLEKQLDCGAAAFCDKDAGGGYTASGTAYQAGRSQYYVSVTGLKLSAADAQPRFSALVTLDAKTADAASPFAAINAEKMANYSNMDAVFAQSWSDTENPDSISLSEFNVQSATDEIAGTPAVTRKIVLTVSYADPPANTKIQAGLEYQYTYSYTVWELNSSGVKVRVSKSWSDTQPYQLFSQGFTLAGNPTPNIYVMYNPWYTGAQDVIDIKNASSINFHLFLVKQKNPVMNDTDLQTKENVYAARITLNQPQTSEAKVYSNAAENLVSPTSRITAVNYTVKYSDYASGSDHAFAGAAEGSEGALVAKSARNRIFEVTVAIYPDGADYTGTPICTFTTTKLQ